MQYVTSVILSRIKYTSFLFNCYTANYCCTNVNYKKYMIFHNNNNNNNNNVIIIVCTVLYNNNEQHTTRLPNNK